MGCRLLFDSWPCFRLSVLCQKKKTTTVSVEIVQLAKSDLRGYGRIRPCIHHICPDFYPILKLVSTCCMIAARTHDFPFSVSHTSFSCWCLLCVLIFFSSCRAIAQHKPSIIHPHTRTHTRATEQTNDQTRPDQTTPANPPLTRTNKRQETF